MVFLSAKLAILTYYRSRRGKKFNDYIGCSDNFYYFCAH